MFAIVFALLIKCFSFSIVGRSHVFHFQLLIKYYPLSITEQMFSFPNILVPFHFIVG